MTKPIKPTINYEMFDQVDLRVGKVVKVEDFPEARKPAWKLWIDFGLEIGIKQSSAQVKKNQTREDILGQRVVCVINFEPRQIGPFRSEVLTLGADDGTTDPSNWILLTTMKAAPEGAFVG